MYGGVVVFFNISHISNGVYQSLIVVAKNEEIAEKYFREQKPASEFLGIHEATNDDKRQGKPIMRVPEGYGLQKPHAEFGKRLGFGEFKSAVRRKGGIWASDDVHFTQFRDGYSASYKPEYPEHSKKDCAWAYNWQKDTWRFEDPVSYDAKYGGVDALIAEAEGQKKTLLPGDKVGKAEPSR